MTENHQTLKITTTTPSPQVNRTHKSLIHQTINFVCQKEFYIFYSSEKMVL